MDPSRAQVAEDDGRGHRGEDAGDAQLIGEHVGAKREDDPDGQLDEVVVDPAHDPRGRVARDEADRHADERRTDEPENTSPLPNGRVRAWRANTNRTSPGAVVEQAFPVDHRGKGPVGLDSLERGDDRGRVGGRDHRPDDEGQLERQAGRGAQDERDDHGRDQDAADGEHQQPAEPSAELADPQPVTGLEDESRQQHDEHQVGVISSGGIPTTLATAPTPSPANDERDRVRDAQRAGHDRHDGGERSRPTRSSMACRSRSV